MIVTEIILSCLQHTSGTSGPSRVGASTSSSAGRSVAGSSGTSTRRAINECGLAAGEVVGDARVDTLGVGFSGRRRAIALVALGGALVGLDDLGSVGASVAQACGLAVNVACIASHSTLDSG